MKKIIVSSFLVAFMIMSMIAGVTMNWGSTTQSNNATTMWYNYGIFQQCSDNYDFKSWDPIVPAYHTLPAGVVLNNEMFKMVATDDNGTTNLTPVLQITDLNNTTSSGSVTIVVDKSWDLPTGFSINNDGRLIAAIPFLNWNNFSTIGMGKILYRIKPTPVYDWSGTFWCEHDLVDNLTLTFPDDSQEFSVQLVVMYEIKEFSTSFWKPHIYTQVKGFYRFNVEA